MPGEAAAIEQIDIIGQRQSAADGFLDQQDAAPLLPQHRQQAIDLLDDDRRQAQGRLVDQQQPATGHQAAADADHAPFATRQRIRLLFLALGQFRQQGEDFLQTARDHRRLAYQIGAHQQVFPYRHFRKQQIALRDMDDAGGDDRLRRAAGDALAGKADLAADLRQQTGNRPQQTGLAVAVWPDHGDAFPLAQLQIQIMQHAAVGIAAGEAAAIEQRRRAHMAAPGLPSPACCIAVAAVNPR